MSKVTLKTTRGDGALTVVTELREDGLFWTSTLMTDELTFLWLVREHVPLHFMPTDDDEESEDHHAEMLEKIDRALIARIA